MSRESEIIELVPFTKEFVKRHADSIDWEVLCSFAPLDLIDEIIADYPDDIKWWKVSRRRDITEAFSRKYSDKIKWGDLSRCAEFEVISSLADDYKEEMHWSYICLRDLPEEFARKYSNKISWYFFSKNIYLSKYSQQFFEDFSSDFHWDSIVCNELLPLEFRESYLYKM